VESEVNHSNKCVEVHQCEVDGHEGSQVVSGEEIFELMHGFAI